MKYQSCVEHAIITIAALGLAAGIVRVLDLLHLWAYLKNPFTLIP